MPYRRGNTLTVGSTQSGKSYGVVHDILGAADTRSISIVVCDPHQESLARKSVNQLIAHGHQKRIVWDQLDELMQTPKYRFLMRSRAKHPLQRAKENHQTAEQFSELLCRRRETHSLATSPLLEEWTMKAILLLLNQPHDHPASDLRYAFKPGHPTFERLVRNCQDPDIRQEFEQIAAGGIRSGQFAGAARLINAVCSAPAFIARCGMAFNLPRFLDNYGILLLEGGPVSQPVLQTILGSVILQTIQYVRNRPRPFPRVLLVLDEATNANLVGAAGHEVRALAECQKMGLDIHILVQSLNFPSGYITDGVLTNCIRHEWYYAASAAVARKAAEDLGDSELEQQIRHLRVGQRYIKERNYVGFEVVPPLPQPWVFPQLAERKVQKAIARIRQRPEYGGNDQCSTGATVTTKSSDLPPDTQSPPGTSSHFSAASRRRTGGRKNSGSKDSSGSSAPSSSATPVDPSEFSATLTNLPTPNSDMNCG
jgi:hypothetical protein